MKIVSLILLCLSLTGCLRSKVMLVDPDKAVFDKNLAGYWCNVEDKHKIIAAIGPSNIETNPAGLVCYQGLNFTDNGKLDDQENHAGRRSEYAFSVIIGQYGYLCTVNEDFAQPEKYREWLANQDFTCEIYRYRVERDQLTFWVGDPSKLGSVGLKNEHPESKLSERIFTGTRAELIEFLRTKSDQLFPDDEKMVFKRVPL
jgi:hypothetical protein